MLILQPSHPYKIYTGGTFAANPQTMKDLNRVDLLSRFAVEEVIILNRKAYQSFIQNLEQPHEFLRGTGGTVSTNVTGSHLVTDWDEWDEEMWDSFRQGAYQVCLVVFKGRIDDDLLYIDYDSGIVVDAQGGDSIQYAMGLNNYKEKADLLKEIQRDVIDRFRRKRRQSSSPARFYLK